MELVMISTFITSIGYIHSQTMCSLFHLQFALFIKVEDAFFEVVHLAEH